MLRRIALTVACSLALAACGEDDPVPTGTEADRGPDTAALDARCQAIARDAGRPAPPVPREGEGTRAYLRRVAGRLARTRRAWERIFEDVKSVPVPEGDRLLPAHRSSLANLISALEFAERQFRSSPDSLGGVNAIVLSAVRRASRTAKALGAESCGPSADDDLLEGSEGARSSA
jgi:hypothetical protein